MRARAATQDDTRFRILPTAMPATVERPKLVVQSNLKEPSWRTQGREAQTPREQKFTERHYFVKAKSKAGIPD